MSNVPVPFQVKNIKKHKTWQKIVLTNRGSSHLNFFKAFNYNNAQFRRKCCYTCKSKQMAIDGTKLEAGSFRSKQQCHAIRDYSVHIVHQIKLASLEIKTNLTC